jgi:hypothetical protein
LRIPRTAAQYPNTTSPASSVTAGWPKPTPARGVPLALCAP